MASSAEGMVEDITDAVYTDDSQQPLGDFIHTHTLPQSVSVAGGSFMSHDIMIARGDVLLLRGMAPSTLTLSIVDTDNGLKKELEVNPDIPVKFLVLPPKDSVQADPGNAEVRSNRPVSMVTYPTVADLLMDSPTYFEANSTYDDPYLPGFSVKPGDRFRFVKVVRNIAEDKMERLQCRTESDELVCLSIRCKGNFTVLEDDTPFTLRQLTDLAKVPRRLKIAPGNDSLNIKGEGHAETYIREMLLSFHGVINMSRPQDMLEASPWDNPESTYSIPVDCNLQVRLFSVTDYEEPVASRRVKPEPLTVFVHEHEYEFPVQATLFSYTMPPDTVAECLSNSREVIVHEKLRTQKLFVKDSKKDTFFAIDESVDISFVQIPRILSSVFQMMSLPLGSQVRVLADIAADFPEPFILHYGDVLCVTKHDSFSWKLKHSSTGDVPIVKCERLVPGGKSQKLKLPLDLEVNLVLLEDPSQLKVTKLADIFSGEDEIPISDVSVLEGNGASYRPLPASLQVLQVLNDSELLISPVSTTTAISPLIKTCVKIPIRHKAVLGLKRKLEFPDGYFVLPSKHRFASVGIECVQESVYEELVQAKKLETEYEDVEIGPCRRESDDDTRSQASSMGRSRYAVHQEAVPRSASSGTLERKRRKDRVKRFSRALNPKNWHLSRGKTSGEHEDAPPPPPVSGILTLSLQPSHATANDYFEEDIGEGSGDTHHSFPLHQGSEAGVMEDEPYEDVELTHSPTTATSSPADINRSHPVLTASLSDGPRLERQKDNFEEGRGHRRHETDPGVKMLVEKERAAKPVSPGRRSKSPHHWTDREVEEKDLEKAPPIRYRRTRSPSDLTASPEGENRRVEKVGEHSFNQGKDSTSSEDSSRQIMRRKAQRHNHEPETARQKHKVLTKTHSPESPPNDTRSAEMHRDTQSPHRPERHRKAHSPGFPSEKPKAHERKKKTQTHDIHSQSPNTLKMQVEADSSDITSELSQASRNQPRLDESRSRKPRSPEYDKSKKLRSPDLDEPASRNRSGQSPPASSSEQSRTHGRHRPTPHPHSPGTPERWKRTQSPDPISKSTPERQGEAQSSDGQSGRQEQERIERGKKSSSLEGFLDQSPVRSGKLKSPKIEKKLLSQSQAESEKSKSLSSEDSPDRPRRRQRKVDSSKERIVNRSIDSLDTDDVPSTPDAVPKQRKTVQEKPAIPPKPVLASKSARNPPPVAPPRKRAARIGSVEAETFIEDSTSKPVLGRKRLS